MKRGKYLISGIVALSMLGGCSPAGLSEAQQEKLRDGQYSEVVKGTTVRSTYSVENSGIFYIGRNNTLLMYYDYDADENYVLCSSPNCRHKDSSCPAHVEDNYSTYSFAYYGGKVYYLRKVEYESEHIQLISMDADGQNQETVAELDAGDYSYDTWTVSSILPVYFSHNKALLQISYKKIISEDEEGNTVTAWGNQLVMIDLSDGEIRELTEVLLYGDEVERLQFVLVTEEFAVYEDMRYEEPVMSENEYIQTYGEEAFKTDYYDYYEEHMNNTQATGVYRAVNLETGEIKEIWSDVMYPSYGEESSYPVMMGPYFIYADKEKIYYLPPEVCYGPEPGQLEMYSIDMDTGKEEQIAPFTEPVNNWLYIDQNSNGRNIYREGEIIFCDYSHEKGTHQMYKYFLATGEMESIREESNDYYVWGMTDERVILSDTDNLHLSWMTKEDYEKGDYGAGKKISFDW